MNNKINSLEELLFSRNTIKNCISDHDDISDFTREDLFHLLLEEEINLNSKEWFHYRYDVLFYLFPNKYIKKMESLVNRIEYGRKSISCFDLISLEETKELSKEDQKIENKLILYQTLDQKKGLDNDLTINWYKQNILNHSCTYCGSRENIGCDRIDNSLGHLQSNCIPCCTRCNLTRSDRFSYKEMLQLGQVIRKIDEQRKLKNIQ